MTWHDWIISGELPVVTGVVGWFTGRRKRKAAVQSMQLKNIQSSMTIYMNMVGDLKKHIALLEKRVNVLVEEKERLQKDLDSYKANMKKYKESDRKLKKRISELEKQLKNREKDRDK